MATNATAISHIFLFLGAFIITPAPIQKILSPNSAIIFMNRNDSKNRLMNWHIKNGRDEKTIKLVKGKKKPGAKDSKRKSKVVPGEPGAEEDAGKESDESEDDRTLL